MLLTNNFSYAILLAKSRERLIKDIV